MASKYDSLTRRRICSAANCTNSPGKNLNISLFRFPKDQDRCRQWIINCRREDLMTIDHVCLHNNYRLCSAHFEDSQFYNPRVKNRLLWNSVPTIFMHDIPNGPMKSYGLHVVGSQQNMQQRIKEGDFYFQAFLHSLPENLALRQSSLHRNSYGIWSQEDIPEGIRFGPYGGALISGSEKQIPQTDKKRVLNETVPNWLEYINHALSKEQQNLIAFQFQEQIFYISCTRIPANTELLAGYRYERGCIRTSIASEDDFCKVSSTCHEPNIYDKSEKTFSLQCYLKLQNMIQTNNTLCKYAEGDKIFYAASSYKCGECGILFKHYTDLKKHSWTHSGIKPYKCDECGRHFTHYTDLKRHKWIHNGMKPYKCDECGRKFAQNYNLKVHKRRRHTGEKPFKCGACGKKYADNADLRRHSLLHTEKNPYKCDVCGKQFVQYNTLRNHTIRLHTGEKPYQCEVCGRRFAENRDIRRHMVRLHNDSKPYGCIECGKKYALEVDLKCHIKRSHSKESPFKCDICGKKFVLRCYLNIHQWIHAKNKPYECDECGKRYTRKTNVNRHKRLHARMTPIEYSEYIQSKNFKD